VREDVMTKEAGSREPLVERIQSELKKSGFPLELHALNVCSRRNTGRLPSLRYEHNKQLREIDLVAFFETIKLVGLKKTRPQHTRTCLIIECKKSEAKPWVFFTSPAYSFESVISFLKYSSDFDRYFSRKRLPHLLPRIFKQLTKSHYSNATIPRGISYTEAFKATTTPSEIYKAIDSVVSYLNHAREIRLAARKEYGVYTEIFLPVILLDGRLYEASLENDQINLEERTHLQLRTFYQEEIYIIDVVTREQFENFFLEVEAFHNEVVSAIGTIKFPPHFMSAVQARIDGRRDAMDADGTLEMMFEIGSKPPQPRKA
jgi:hypothetical protein